MLVFGKDLLEKCSHHHGRRQEATTSHQQSATAALHGIGRWPGVGTQATQIMESKE